jgi:hypothetical protein
VLLGFAELAEKLALDPTATATAAMSAVRAPSARIGWRATKSKVVILPVLSVAAVPLMGTAVDAFVIVRAGEARAGKRYENGLWAPKTPRSSEGLRGMRARVE